MTRMKIEVCTGCQAYMMLHDKPACMRRIARSVDHDPHVSRGYTPFLKNGKSLPAECPRILEHLVLNQKEE